MRRILLLVTVALVMALMLALSGPALANHGAAHGGGGHIDAEFFTGGQGGNDQGGGGGSGGCLTFLGERECGGGFHTGGS